MAWGAVSVLLTLTVVVPAATADAESIHGAHSKRQTVEDRLAKLELDITQHAGLIQMLQVELVNEQLRIVTLEEEVLELKTNNTALVAKVDYQEMLMQMLQVEQANESIRLFTLEDEVSLLKTQTPDSAQAVAFTVRFAKDEFTMGVPIGPREILKFDNIVLNVGQGYDSNTGMFTVPVAGVYTFFLTLMGTNERGPVELAIVTSTVILDIVYAEGAADTMDQRSTQVVTHLAAGEQLWVRQELGDAVRGNWWTVFTGFLVQADREETHTTTTEKTQRTLIQTGN